MAGHLEGFLRAVQPYLEQYGYGALFGCLLLEGFGLPLPGEIMLIAAGMMAAMGQMRIAPVLLTAWSQPLPAIRSAMASDENLVGACCTITAT